MTGSGQPLSSLTWNVLFDTDADGYKEFVVMLDGTDAGSHPDDIVVIYDNSPLQTFDTTQAGIWRQDCAGPNDGVNGASGTSSTWDMDSDPYVWNFGRIRIVQINQALSPGNNNSEYFIDIQVLFSTFDATGIGGPRRLYLTVNPVNYTGGKGGPITMSVVSADGLQLALPNSHILASGPITIPDIQTIAFNIPLFGKAPVIVFTKTALKDTVSSGEAVDLRILVSNIGNDIARAVSVVDTLNSGWKLLKTDTGLVTKNIIRWTLGDLQPGRQDTLRIQAEASVAGPALTNRA